MTPSTPHRLARGKPGHPLSLKDASLADHLAELRDMGVSILKLEGRMKRPEYVAVVTRIYAALLKEKRKPTPFRQMKAASSRLSSRPSTTQRIPRRAASSAPARV